MEFTHNNAHRVDEIIGLFRDTFAASEGADEGDVIAQLVTRMCATVAEEDIYVISALQEGALAGAIVFTRMCYPQDNRVVFILSPVAVAPGQQGKGVGQRLITHGLDQLRRNGVDVVLTYGDIRFYAKVGFAQIGQDIARAPLPLAYPDGWLGQALGSETLAPLQGGSTCVDALNDPALW